MYPELFKIGPFTVYSYGLMLGLAFVAASLILHSEFKRKNIPSAIAIEITLLSVIFGIIGGKLLYLLENIELVFNAPVSFIFSPEGLTFYGGFILTSVVLWFYLKHKRISFWKTSDAIAPALVVGYGIGRLGCHLAGDGDYGIPTDLPWAVSYANGTVPPSVAFIGTETAEDFSNGIVPNDILLHPTPVYEFILAFTIFFTLWFLRKKNWRDGKLFVLFLVLFGLARFLVEFIRINPKLIFDLTEAQLISLILIIIGNIGFLLFSKEKTALKTS